MPRRLMIKQITIRMQDSNEINIYFCHVCYGTILDDNLRAHLEWHALEGHLD